MMTFQTIFSFRKNIQAWYRNSVRYSEIRQYVLPIPPKLDGWYHLYQNTPETIYASNTSIEAFLNLDYAQFIAVKDFLHPEAQYSTEHGVKGEEYDNVIFVISKGWNQYQFETYAPMITKKLSSQVENKLPLSVTAICFMYVVQGQRKGWFSL